MHPNPVYRQGTRERNLAFARDRAFGVLAVCGPQGPLLSHVPFLLSGDGASADLHLVRSNPIARADAAPAVIAVSGPDGYVSPDWYGIDDQVPTWNYVAVHLRGRLEPLPPETMADMLDRQSEGYETRLLPKPPWTTGKLNPDTHARLVRMIQPFRLRIDAVDGTWKLGQNKSPEARTAAARAMATAGMGQETDRLSRLMQSGT